MKQHFRIVVFCLLGLITTGARGAAPTPSPTPADPPKPSISVTLERQSIRENDSLQVNARFANEWDQGLTGVKLFVDGPSSLSWHAHPCAEIKAKPYSASDTENAIDIGPIRPNEVRSTVLCAKSGPSIDVGTFNLSFTYDYTWKKQNADRHSFVTIEKPLSANLFGSDNVAGVPIALAAFIVPGLFFWLILGWLKFSWNIGVALGEKLIYSVLTSIPLLFLVNYFMTDAAPGISFGKLAYYALTGSGVGFVIGLVDFGRRRAMQHFATKQANQAQERAAEETRIAKAKEVKLGDNSRILLGKLLHMYPKYQNPRAVLSTEEKQFEGSLAAQTDEAAALIGWFQIEAANITQENKAQIIRELNDAKSPLDLFLLAEKYRLPIDERNPIKCEGNELSLFSKTFPNKDIQVEVLDGQGSEAPLVLV